VTLYEKITKSDRLDQLVQEAHERELQPKEIRELTRLARVAGEDKIKEIIISFIGANSIACQNLVRAGGLRRIHGAVAKQTRSIQTITRERQSGVINVTAHAAERYIQRIDPNVTIEEATKIIEKEAVSAIKSKTKSKRKKDEIWIAPSGFQIIVKRDEKGSIPVAATIVPKDETTEPDRPLKDGPKVRKIYGSIK